MNVWKLFWLICVARPQAHVMVASFSMIRFLIVFLSLHALLGSDMYPFLGLVHSCPVVIWVCPHRP
jgi:hypothetical protein